MNYVVAGLDPAPFAPLFTLDDAALAARGVVPVVAEDAFYPCRVSLEAAAIGDRLLLLNHQHQPAASPYRSAHAIYVAQGSKQRGVFRNAIPPVMRSKTLSVRAFDARHMIVDADLAEGAQAEALIARLFADPSAAYLHIHFAKRGCFAARVDRG